MNKTAETVLITAGPTREKIDAVRFLSNRSSGKMGYALAQAATEAGFRVVLVSGPTALTPPEGVALIDVESAAEMARAVHRLAPSARLIIMAAAVADYRPLTAVDYKLKKLPGKLVLELERTEDILQSLGQRKRPGQVLVGFAAETDDLLANAQGKLERKNLDWIAANDVRSAVSGFGVDTNAITLLSRDGRQIEIPLADKLTVARRLLEIVARPISS